MLGLRFLLTTGWLILVPLAALAGEADVVDVKVRKTGEQTFAFDVTVRHGDTGWKHYANKWDVVTSEGKVLGTRILYHPHEDEQPFTRSLSGMRIPSDITSLTIRAYDKVHATGGVTKTVTVPH